MTLSTTDPAASTIDGDEAYCSACNKSYPPTTEVCPHDGQKLVRFRAEPDALLGSVVDGRFEVIGRLGRGGMGTVYRARQRSVDREIALKVVDAKLSHDRGAAKRFLREARLASRLQHAGIVAVHDFGQSDDGVLYLAMELLRGRTLTAVIDDKPMSPSRAVAIAAQLADALVCAHREGIIHRDLKPQNVVVLDEPAGRDVLKVLDFGLAKSLGHGESGLTHSDALVGTPLYMAPEAIQGKDVDARADLYALGCILHELLTGRPPFAAGTISALLARHIGDPPPPVPSTTPAPLRALVDALLAKDPANRPADAATVATRLAEIAAASSDPSRFVTPDAQVEARFPPRAFAESEAPARRARWPWIVVALAAIAGGGVALALALSPDEPAAVATPPDATPEVVPPPPVIVPDAAMAITPDAGVPDAAPTVPTDARPRRDRTVDAGAAPQLTPPPPAPIDAAVTPPTSPTVPDGGARRTIDFILPDL